MGISGQEGMQAANSADFAISQFRFLRDLLLVQEWPLGRGVGVAEGSKWRVLRICGCPAASGR